MSNWWDGMPIGEALRRGLAVSQSHNGKVVRVAPNIDAQYWNQPFIEKVIREIESRSITAIVHPYTDLEKFAIMVIASAANIELDKITNEQTSTPTPRATISRD